VDKDFVKMSVTWSLLEMNRISRDLEEIISRIKWKSISTCFMRAWIMGFDERYVAPIFSHHNIGGTLIGIPSSDGRDYQESYVAVFDNALYSALVLNRATVACFLQLQEIRLFPTKTQYPPGDRRSSLHPTQSVSWKACKLVEINC
jgi:hypothetical protein